MNLSCRCVRCRDALLERIRNAEAEFEAAMLEAGKASQAGDFETWELWMSKAILMTTEENRFWEKELISERGMHLDTGGHELAKFMPASAMLLFPDRTPVLDESLSLPMSYCMTSSEVTFIDHCAT